MCQAPQAAVCLFALEGSPDALRRCLGSILKHVPRERIELRLAFSHATDSLHYTLGTLTPDGAWPRRIALPGGIERFEFTADRDLRVTVWHAPQRVPREQLARLLFHDVPLSADYAICLDQGACVEAGWWDALAPLLDKGIDYIGQPAWHEFRATELERLQAQPWFLGVPPARREGRPGVSYMRDGFVVVRSERLREGHFPPPGWPGRGDVLLGTIAHQLGWSQAHAECVNLEHESKEPQLAS